MQSQSEPTNPTEHPKADTVTDLLALERRAKGISEWLKKNGRTCFDEQKHLDQDTEERIYWHYGYLAALTDILAYLSGERLPSRDPDSQPPDTCN